MRIKPFTAIMRYIVAAIMVVLALYGLYSLLRPQQPAEPGQKIEAVALSPISRSEITRQLRLITVERQYTIPVVGRSYKPLPGPRSGVLGQVVRDILGNRDAVPGTTTNIVYEMVTTVTVGIDLGRLTDADIVNGDTVTTLTLPAPEVMTVEQDTVNSRIYSKDSPTLPYLDNSAALLQELQRKGKIKHREEAAADEQLMARARQQAREALGALLEKVHPGRDVRILFHDAKKSLPPG